MEKNEIISNITRILSTYGCFSVGELDGEAAGVCTGELGNYVAIAEYFTEDYCEVNVYKPSSFSSDPVDIYDQDYGFLNEDILADILLLCEEWEAICIKTEKRSSN
jgi:hypothetical protein